MHYFQITETNELPNLAKFTPFKAVIVLEDSLDSQRRRQVAQWLVSSGCRYAMVCGEDGEQWEAALRQANIDEVPLETMTPQDFVMITWHKHDKLRAVFRYADKHARHSHARLEQLLTIHIGNTNRAIEHRSIYGGK